MNTKGFGTTSQHKAYCGKHSAQQKEEDAQRFGPEELRSMKRMREEEPARAACNPGATARQPCRAKQGGMASARLG
uniref:Uncharacterized protein n=1 Tax=Setaria italica TaxID=4555 RepID=K3YFL3_SETIT